jgi:hypothetical protein
MFVSHRILKNTPALIIAIKDSLFKLYTLGVIVFDKVLHLQKMNIHIDAKIKK